MSVEIKILGEAAGVKIEVLRYENRSAQNPSDANWLMCHAEVHVRSFAGRVDVAFTTHDFAAFGKCLRSAVTDLDGTATFETDENALRLVVELSRTGVAHISGALRDVDSPQTYLAFSFESDQTFLGRTANDVDELLRRFPVRT